jgi:hypothetical protein
MGENPPTAVERSGLGSVAGRQAAPGVDRATTAFSRASHGNGAGFACTLLPLPVPAFLVPTKMPILDRILVLSGSHDDRGKHGLTIALSGQPGTPVTEVGQEVGRLLSWPVFDREVVELVAARMHLPVRQVQAIDETVQNWGLDGLEGFACGADLETRYVHQVHLLLHSLAEQGNCVILGRGAAELLDPPFTLRVRLVGRLLSLPRKCDLVLGPKWSVARCARRIVQAVAQKQGQAGRLRA